MNLHDPRRLRDPQTKPRRMLRGNEGKTRLASLPDVPLLMELGYTDIETVAWQGLVVPAATPKDIEARLSAELQKALLTEAVRSQFAVMGIEPTPTDATTLQKHGLQESQYWPRLIRERNTSLD